MSQTVPTRQRGYTLLELLVALGVIALMATLIPTLFVGFLPSVEIRAAADEISSDMLDARNQSRLSGQTVIYSAEVMKDQGFEITILPHPDFKDSDLGKIEFYPNGRSSGGILVLSKNDREILITVDWLTGKVGGQDG